MGDIDRLRAFVAIHRTGSVTEAARLLHMSQPAVTQQLQALEALAGRRLFRRLPRGVEPTPAGRELAEQVGSHLDAVEEAWGQWLGRAGGGAHDDELRGASVYLGGPSEFMSGRVLPALAPLLTAGVRLRVSVGDDVHVLRGLESRELDLGVLTSLPEQRRGITVELLAREEFVLVAAPDVAVEIGQLATGRRGARQLQDVALLAYAEELPLIRGYWQQVFGGEPETLASVVADSLPALAGLAERGLGITVLPRPVCEDALLAGRLVQLVRPREAPSSDLFLAWWSGSRRTRSVAAAYERLHDMVGAQATGADARDT